MSKNDRQKLSILVILLAVLGLTLVLGYQINRPAVTAAVQPPETRTSANPPAATDARIRLDLVEKPEAAGEEVGRKNVFQYGQTPAAPSGSRGGSVPNVLPGPNPGAVVPQPIRPPVPNLLPPGPPPIPLKYQGYALEKAPKLPGQAMTAFLVDEASHHYNVRTGDILMGKYRVATVTNNSVEIEDIENNRRQTLPLLK
jgi:hypothetical protein